MNTPSEKRKGRAREVGFSLPGVPGPDNALTDLDGVLVGYSTLSSHSDSSIRTGELPIQTGVTAILPRGFDSTPRPVWAGMHALNGNGEMTGSHWVKDAGYFVGPVMLTNTHSVGIVHDATTRWMLEKYRQSWECNHLWAMPVVAETYDGVLNDINGLHIRTQHALDALASASSGPVDEGNVGGGAGMICYEYKGGTGTSSRLVELDGDVFTVGTLVQANHGIRPWMTVQGVPVGQHLTDERIPGMKRESGSIVCIIGTDIPLLPSQLDRLARRATLGIGRGGTPGGNNSGDIFLAFSVANSMNLPQLAGPWKTMHSLNDELLDAVYLAAVEAIDEAVLNALCAAVDVPTARPAGSTCRAMNVEEVLGVMRQYSGKPYDL